MLLSKEKYLEVQTQIALIAQIVDGLPLKEFLEDASHADTLGAVFDPTLYAKAMRPLEMVILHAQALRKFQNVIRNEKTMR